MSHSREHLRDVQQDHEASVEAILGRWEEEGPLIHAPTGFPTLDELTGGGPVYGSRWYLLGAPDAGKTAFLVQVVDRFLADGDVGGILAADEEPGDMLSRFFQRRGFSRDDCERRAAETMRFMRGRGPELQGLRLFGPDVTIEQAAARTAARAQQLGRRGMLAIDSIQTVTCAAEVDSSLPAREAITARVRAVRAVAAKHQLWVLATSEMSRSAYRSIASAEDANDMASAKESGAIEYSARVLLALRSVQEEKDLLELNIAKNKHGPRDVQIGLRINRRLQELTEEKLPDEPDVELQRREERTEKAKAQTVLDAAVLVELLLEQPGLGGRELEDAMRARLGMCSAPRAGAARAKLGRAVKKINGKGTRCHLHLIGALIPEDVIAALPPSVRAKAASAVPSKEAVLGSV